MLFRDDKPCATRGKPVVIGYNGSVPIFAAPCPICGDFSREFHKKYCPECGARLARPEETAEERKSAWDKIKDKVARK